MNLVPLEGIPLPGNVCLARCREDGFVCRAVVTNEVDGDYQVFYVDFGNYEVVNIQSVYEIPFRYVIPKVMAVRFALAGVEKSKVTIEMQCAFKKFVDNRLIHMKVLPMTTRSALPCCELWDPESKVTALDVIKQARTGDFLETIMLNRGFCQPVKVSFVYSCSKFFVQLQSKQEELARLMLDIQVFCRDAPPLSSSKIKVGVPCFAKYEGDQQWYRAQVTEILQNQEVLVFYMDFGNCDAVQLSLLKTMDLKQLTILKPQAIECCLNGYQNMQPDLERDGLLEELILEQQFTMKVVEKYESKVLVELIDSNNYNVSSLLLDKIATSRSQATPMLVQDGNKIEQRKPSLPMASNKEQAVEERFESENEPVNFRQQNKGPRNSDRNRRDNESIDSSDNDKQYSRNKSDFRDRGFNKNQDKYNKDQNRKPDWYEHDTERMNSSDDINTNNEWIDSSEKKSFNIGYKNDRSGGRRFNADNERTGGKRFERDNDNGGGRRFERNNDGNERSGGRRFQRDNDGSGGRRFDRDNDSKSFQKRDKFSDRKNDNWGNDEKTDDNWGKNETKSNWHTHKNNNDDSVESNDNKTYGDKKQNWGERRDKWNSRDNKNDNWSGNDNKGDNWKSEDKRESKSERKFHWDSKEDRPDRDHKPYKKKFEDNSNDWTKKKSNDFKIPTKAGGDSWSSPAADVPDPASSTDKFLQPNVENVEGNVIISWFHNPTHFYLQFENTQVEFKQLMTEIQEAYKGKKTSSAVIGQPVIALFPEDNVLYRGEILDTIGSSFKVYFVDFGNISEIDKVWLIEKRFMNLAVQAISAKLSGIEPTVDSWLESSCYSRYFDRTGFFCKFTNLENDKFDAQLFSDNEDIASMLIRDGLAKSPIALVEPDLPVLIGQQFRALLLSFNSLGDFTMCLQTGYSFKCSIYNLSASTETWEDNLKDKIDQILIIYVDDLKGDRLQVTLYDQNGLKIKLINNDEEAFDHVDLLSPYLILNSSLSGIITHIEENTLFLQPSDCSQKIEYLTNSCYEFYENNPIENKIEPVEGFIYAVKGSDSNWYRARVTKIIDNFITINYVDYGNYEEVDKSAIRDLALEFMEMPVMCITVVISGINEELIGQFISLNLTFTDNGIEGVIAEEQKIVPSTERLAIIPEQKITELPPSVSETKTAVYISHIDSPNDFYLQLLESQNAINDLQALLQEKIPEMMDIENPVVGALCGARYCLDENWYRAQILDADSDITTVRFVDYGNTDVLDNTNSRVKTLPSNLLTLEVYATRCRLNIKSPMEEWSSNAIEKFEELCSDDGLLAEFLNQDEKISYVKLYSNGRSFSEILIEEKLAILDIVTNEANSIGFVSHLNSLSEFWIQLENCVEELEFIAEQLTNAESFMELQNLAPGALCAALFPDDLMWYRARILASTESGAEVVFIDYGNSCISSSLRELPEDLVMVPPLAQKCSLQKPEVIPNWTPEMLVKFQEIAAEGQTTFTVRKLTTGETSVVELLIKGETVTKLLLANPADEEVISDVSNPKLQHDIISESDTQFIASMIDGVVSIALTNINTVEAPVFNYHSCDPIETSENIIHEVIDEIYENATDAINNASQITNTDNFGNISHLETLDISEEFEITFNSQLDIIPLERTSPPAQFNSAYLQICTDIEEIPIGNIITDIAENKFTDFDSAEEVKRNSEEETQVIQQINLSNAVKDLECEEDQPEIHIITEKSQECIEGNGILEPSVIDSFNSELPKRQEGEVQYETPKETQKNEEVKEHNQKGTTKLSDNHDIEISAEKLPSVIDRNDSNLSKIKDDGQQGEAFKETENVNEILEETGDNESSAEKQNDDIKSKKPKDSTESQEEPVPVLVPIKTAKLDEVHKTTEESKRPEPSLPSTEEKCVDNLQVLK